MTITELIERLEEIRDKHGDLDVEYDYNDCGDDLGGSTDVEDVTVETIKSSSNERTFARISCVWLGFVVLASLTKLKAHRSSHDGKVRR